MSMHKGILGQQFGGATVSTEKAAGTPATTPGFDRHPYMAHSTADPGTEQTLEQYIRRKQRNDAFNTVKAERKLTFEEWFNDRCGGDTYTQQEDIKARMQWAWEAAQENMP